MIFKIFVGNPSKIEVPYAFPPELDFARFISVSTQAGADISYNIIAVDEHRFSINGKFSISIDESYKDTEINIQILAPIQIQNHFNRASILALKKNMEFLNLVRDSFDFDSSFEASKSILFNEVGILETTFSIHMMPYGMPSSMPIITQREKDIFDIIFRKISSKVTVSDLASDTVINFTKPYVMFFYHNDFNINRISFNVPHDNYNDYEINSTTRFRNYYILNNRQSYDLTITP